ncbi:MAG: helix-turn-helix domain-containing protein [Nanoarchaeota archaeon]
MAKKLLDGKIRRMYELDDEGISKVAIARELGVARQTVHYYLKKKQNVPEIGVAGIVSDSDDETAEDSEDGEQIFLEAYSLLVESARESDDVEHVNRVLRNISRANGNVLAEPFDTSGLESRLRELRKKALENAVAFGISPAELGAVYSGTEDFYFTKGELLKGFKVGEETIKRLENDGELNSKDRFAINREPLYLRSEVKALVNRLNADIERAQRYGFKTVKIKVPYLKSYVVNGGSDVSVKSSGYKVVERIKVTGLPLNGEH